VAENAPADQAPARQTQGAAAMPDPYKLNLLIRTTIIALNQANMSGNYSVLRDLGTPKFQAANTDANLVEIFAGLRKRNLDLSPILFFDPKLVREPQLQPNGLLRLTGYIPTKPERLLFDMGFESIEGRWRLSAIVIDIQPAPADAAGAGPQAKKGPTKAAGTGGAKAKGGSAPAKAAPLPRPEPKQPGP
jgi:hypothetical protein